MGWGGDGYLRVRLCLRARRGAARCALCVMRYVLCAVRVPLSAPTVRDSHALSWSWRASLSQRTVRSSRAHSCAFVLAPPCRGVCPVGAVHRRMTRCAVLQCRTPRCFASQNFHDHHSCGARTQADAGARAIGGGRGRDARSLCVPPPLPPSRRRGSRVWPVTWGVEPRSASRTAYASNNETRWCSVHYARDCSG
ncbi:hypothetical protein FB451DRAFT_272815 [Mycena latifolia]|nr:hypothetical protein FB451DRAFT_272815 [Mycena latifolia]